MTAAAARTSGLRGVRVDVGASGPGARPRDDHARELGLPGGRSRWVVCEDCGLVYQSPRPGVAAVGELYAGGDYHEIRGGVPEHYVQYSLRRSRGALDWAGGQAQLHDRPGRALDIGCGVGGAMVDLRERGWQVVGVEPDPVLAEVGRTRFGLEVRNGFFDSTTFSDDESFDLVYSCHVWEHLAAPRETCMAAHELLAKTRGHLLIVVPTFRRARTLAWSCFTAPHTYMFTEVSLGNLLEATGFDVVLHRYAAGADTELWLLARARTAPGAPGTRHPAPRVARRRPTRARHRPAACPARAARPARRSRAHAEGGPTEFTARLTRWSRSRLDRVQSALTAVVGLVSAPLEQPPGDVVPAVATAQEAGVGHRQVRRRVAEQSSVVALEQRALLPR